MKLKALKVKRFYKLLKNRNQSAKKNIQHGFFFKQKSIFHLLSDSNEPLYRRKGKIF